MKKDYKLNANYLVSIGVHDKKKCKYIEFLPETKDKFFGLVKGRKSGFYSVDFMGGGHYSIKELEEGKFSDTKLIVEDTNAYYPPYVEMKFTNGDKFVKQSFTTFEEASEWSSKIMPLDAPTILINL